MLLNKYRLLLCCVAKVEKFLTREIVEVVTEKTSLK